MLVPPEGYRKNGWKCWTVGDDIAWLRVGTGRPPLGREPGERLLPASLPARAGNPTRMRSRPRAETPSSPTSCSMRTT
ncbi:MAG: hypothetical protein ACLUNO_10935 [Oscillospiraceae bacterium]